MTGQQPSSEVVLQLNNNVQKIGEGFLLTDTLFPGINPFQKGHFAENYERYCVVYSGDTG